MMVDAPGERDPGGPPGALASELVDHAFFPCPGRHFTVRQHGFPVLVERDWIQPGENLRREFNHRYWVPGDGYFRIPGEHDRTRDQY